MKRLGIIILLFLLSCNQDKEVNFDYELMEGNPGILVKNYTPVSRQELTKFLTKVGDTLKMNNFNVMLNADNIQQINPEFKGRFFRGSVGKTELSYVNNDTAKLMSRLNFGIGTF